MLAPRAVLVSAALAVASAASACSSFSSRFGKALDGICVCNVTHCDAISNEYANLTTDRVGVFQTSRAGDRLAYTTLATEAAKDAEVPTIVIDSSVTYQKILGFGGAFTDATSIVTYKLEHELQEKVLEAYFGASGLQYTLGRVPIGSTDFSDHVYSYNDLVDDLEMANFTIAIDKSNATNKMAFVKRALAKTSRDMKLFASSWAPPVWMTREKKVENGHIIGEPGEPYWQALALYYSRFFDEYKKEGVTFWAMTTQNEPNPPPLSLLSWQQLRFNTTQERDFLKKDLGPLLKKNHPELKIMILDDQKDDLPKWDAALVDPEARQYVAGVAVHWYKNLDFIAEGAGNFKELADFHAKYPDVFILATEACEGSMPDLIGTGRGTKLQEPDIIWKRGENYARDIINDLANFAAGWTDWNMVLDTAGGPNWATNVVDAPIIVDEKSGTEFYKQPMYYVMGHFSKFLPVNSTRVALNVSSAVVNTTAFNSIDRVAFLTPQQQVVLILQNRANTSLDLTVRDAQSKRDVRLTLPANAVQTVLFGNGSAKEDGSSKPPGSNASSSLMAIHWVVGIAVALVSFQ